MTKSALSQKNIIRRRFLESIAIIFVLLVLLTTLLVIPRIYRFGWEFTTIIETVSNIPILIVYFYRKQLPEKVLIFFYLFLLVSLSFLGFYRSGLISPGFIFAIAAIFITIAMFGKRAGIIFIGFYIRLLA